MKEFENNAYFWQKLDALYLSGDFKIIYRKGQVHPRFPELIFPCDYGHIETIKKENENAMSVRVLKGSGSSVDGLVVVANVLDKEIEPILLVGLTEQENDEVLEFLNYHEHLKTVVIRRGNGVPDWAIQE